MRYVVEQFGFWIVVALVLGLTVGWVAARQPNARREGRFVQAYLLLAAAGGVVVYGAWVRSAAGLWFETAVLFGAAYLIGCILGSLVAPAAKTAQPNPPNP